MVKEAAHAMILACSLFFSWQALQADRLPSLCLMCDASPKAKMDALRLQEDPDQCMLSNRNNVTT